MTETLPLLLLSFSAFTATVAAAAALAVFRHSRVIARRLHDVLGRLDEVIRAIPESDAPQNLDALRVEVEWLVDTLTSELAGRARADSGTPPEPV